MILGGQVLYKKLQKLCEQSKPKYCQNDQFSLFLILSSRSSIAYISALIVYIGLFYKIIPEHIFIPLISAHFTYQMLRFYLFYKYKNKVLNEQSRERFRTQHTWLLFFGGVFWGLGSIFAMIYAPAPYEYIVLTLVVAIAAGSISTLSSLYRVYVAFNLPMLILLMLSFIYQGGELHLYMAIVIPIFTFVVLSASWDMHKNQKRTIELKELFAQAQDELTEINASLEERISTEVAHNRQKDQQMLEQSRLAQMGEMISMIAHQWRQPLSAITATTGTMSLQMQLEDECDPSSIEEGLQKVNTYTQYLSTTITDFRNFFKPDKEKTLTSLNDIVLGSLKIIGTSLESQGIHLETFLESKEEFLSFPNELKQVVLNILKNAQDAFSENKTKNPCILLKSISLEDKVQLIISDNAGGINEDKKAYIFDPYFTTKEKRDGTGLGLYMSKMIVEDHCHGHVSVENIDNGASFILTLPLSKSSV